MKIGVVKDGLTKAWHSTRHASDGGGCVRAAALGTSLTSGGVTIPPQDGRGRRGPHGNRFPSDGRHKS